MGGFHERAECKLSRDEFLSFVNETGLEEKNLGKKTNRSILSTDYLKMVRKKNF